MFAERVACGLSRVEKIDYVEAEHESLPNTENAPGRFFVFDYQTPLRA